MNAGQRDDAAAGALDRWPAPRAPGPVDATVAVPGSKSMTNRALVLAALAGEESRIHRPLRSRDTLLMASGLRAMGTAVADDGGDWLVTPRQLAGPASVDVGNAGTVMRFLPPVATLVGGDVSFDGDSRAGQRPVGPLLDGLRALGADIDDGGRGALPCRVRGRGALSGGAVTLDASGSSQLVSALLLAAPRFDKGVEVRHEGPPMPSAPHVAMTVGMLRAAGVEVDASSPNSWRVAAGPIRAGDLTVEPDLSNAAPFLAAAAATGGRVTVTGWPSDTTQPGAALPRLLSEMGAACTYDSDGLTVNGDAGLHGIDADLRDSSELAPTIAGLAALAGSPSRLTGIGHMRHQETDRLAALAREIGRLGGEVRELPDGLVVRPCRLHGGLFHTYDDHRLATTGALLGLTVAGVEVENIATTGKTLPGFTDLWSDMLGVGCS